MKKISIVFSCVLVLSMLFLISTTAASNIEIDYSYYDTSSVDFSLTEEDNFIPDSLTIVLKKQYSGGFKRWDKFDFARIKNFDYNSMTSRQIQACIPRQSRKRYSAK